MATEPKRIYIDTNILAYVVNTKAPHHRAALEILRPCETEILCISSQVLAEFYSYITNPAILAQPLEPTEAISRTGFARCLISVCSQHLSISLNVG